MFEYLMFNGAPDLSLLGDLLAALAYTAFALNFALRLWRKTAPAHSISYLFTAALAGSALWAWLELVSDSLHWPGRLETLVLPFADLLRYGLWFLFVLSLLRPSAEASRRGGDLRALNLLAGASVGAALLLLLARESGAEWAALLERPSAFAALMLAVVGLILLEQLWRNVSSDTRWNAKPVCLGLGAIFAFDLFVYSQAALFRKFDSDALIIRAAVHSAAVPLLFLASRRHADWLNKLHVSRAAVFHSATLLLVGAYLLLVSAVGYYVRYTGGEWGRALQLVLVFVALIALAVLVVSGSMRARLKVYISKNFFNYRYDYREEWLRFTAVLSSGASPQEMGVTVVRALANLVESPSGALWLRHGPDAEFAQAARWNVPPVTEREAVDASLARFLAERGWIVDLDQLRRGDADYAGLEAPAWLLAEARYWLAVPLLVGGELIGFVCLGHARTAVEINWEVRDLLKTASSQASSYLAQMQAAEALLESKKFDAFNRMSAFVVHDLKNIVTQLSLMMKNAKRLRDNPEFQQDMLDTVENSLEKMRQLMLQLREGDKPHGVSSGVDLQAIARRLQQAAVGKGRVLELELLSQVSTRGHEERIERVIGHVVQNAFDASAADAPVSLRLDSAGSQAQVRISDRGCGMSEDFIQNRLFKPFQTTKANGMGIGAYESYQYLQELGGKISVESKLNRGTTVTILLPLFHATTVADMSMIGAK
ncbi:XrtA/PEP-CTERM system histidine kinase PrsK [Roseateles violae]|uniref:histidine kinase n=1 Tax=Roseateles violae TaxID=3058042 RepID=A0ABT8DR34_9BURK|nr:XrtA/PEP-CTERM system histidine kinase PrsK [Pelomonas sp. PFR6]MDN3920433.1 PEP-CTERM system histidine kinase PrsK [Pelomonas sp. PFR6]